MTKKTEKEHDERFTKVTKTLASLGMDPQTGKTIMLAFIQRPKRLKEFELWMVESLQRLWGMDNEDLTLEIEEKGWEIAFRK